MYVALQYYCLLYYFKLFHVHKFCRLMSSQKVGLVAIVVYTRTFQCHQLLAFLLKLYNTFCYIIFTNYNVDYLFAFFAHLV
jgi:hypothetical protein